MTSARTASLRQRAISTAIALVLLMASRSALAANRYVDNSGSPACSNSTSAGSEAQPWCTIAYGVTQIDGGDDLFVKQGTYTSSSLNILGPAGTASNPTVIRAYPGHNVTIRGGGNGGRVKIGSTSYLTFDGFIISNFNQGLFIEASSNITVQNCTVHTVGQEAIHVRQNSSYVTIEGCEVYNTEQLGGCCNGEGIYIGTGSAGPLDNSHHITVRDNVIHDTTDEGIELKPGTHDCIVEGNTLYNVGLTLGGNTGAIEVNQREEGVQTWTGNPNHLVRNNLIHDSATGIRLGTGATAYNNVIYSPIAGKSGIYVNNSSGDNFPRQVYHNTIHMTSNAVVIAGGTSADVRNNIGPTTSNNLAFNAQYFVNANARDYRLVAGSAPVDAGVNLSSVVSVDKDGNTRPVGPFPDYGAYEFGQSVALPSAPQNLRIVP
ncbi:MAG TPA: right-handed parallel beta-helix repeat-containing protein [Vicinamibacterales bacterium]|nr:right-handed parallel beta-helix repeat-containing protein [Vicinamibacterales bacterium]